MPGSALLRPDPPVPRPLSAYTRTRPHPVAAAAHAHRSVSRAVVAHAVRAGLERYVHGCLGDDAAALVVVRLARTRG
ncbi:hypothetical protein ABZ746_02495 [Streptomyces sp. NPDC020096]